MRLSRLSPSPALQSLVREFTVVEATLETTRTLIPEPSVVVGFRFAGSARVVEDGQAAAVPDLSMTGLRASARRMTTSAGGGVILAVLHEAAAAQLFPQPPEQLFGQSLALDQLFDGPARSELGRAAGEIAAARSHTQRQAHFERFLLGQRQPTRGDALAAAALRAIRASRGSIRIADLARQLGIGIDALEKRFRAAVGTSPKQLASIVRLRLAVDAHRPGTTLTRLSLEAGYFNQSHFIREFRSVTGQAPRQFFSAATHC